MNEMSDAVKAEIEDIRAELQRELEQLDVDLLELEHQREGIDNEINELQISMIEIERCIDDLETTHS
jgi:prefoldin subunit 5